MDHSHFWSARSTSVGDTRNPPANDVGLQPPLPSPDFHPVVWNLAQPVLADEPNSDRFSADDQTMGTLARTTLDRLSANEASLKTPSGKS